METCPQCQKSIKSPHARLVRDECGHKKCRICLIRDEDGCHTCATKNKINAEKKYRSEKKLPLHPASTRKQREKTISCQSEGDEKLPSTKAEEKDEAKTSSIEETKDELMPEKINDNMVNDQVASELSPTVTIEADNKEEVEVCADNNNDEKQIGSGSEEEIKEVKDERKRKPLVIASHITVTPGNPTTYTCTICIKTFKGRKHVRYHNFCASGDKPFKCEYCDRVFVTKSHYDCHILNHTGDRPFVCETCNKGFRQKDKLTRHMRIHTGEKPYVCQTCDKSFSASYSLKAHYRIHTGEKPYLCTQCGRRFSEAMNLRKHLVVHSGEKNFTCEDCGKRFGHKYSLIYHRRSHSRDRPFWCNKCCRNFFTEKVLKRHSLVHSDERPYSCSICDLSFRRKDNLERHMRNTHPETRMVNYGQIDKDCQNPPQQQKNESNPESTVNSNPTNSISKHDTEQTIQQQSSCLSDNQEEENVQNSKSQKTSCIKSVSRAKDKEKVKLYVELVVPPNLLKKPPVITEQNSVEEMAGKSQKSFNASKNKDIATKSVNNGNLTSYRDSIHSPSLTSLGTVPNLITGSMNQIQNLSVKETMNTVQDLSAVSTINSFRDLNPAGTLNLVQNASVTGKITSVQDMGVSGTLNPIHNLSSAGTLNSVQNISDTGALNSVQDLSISNYNPTHITSFKQMLGPVSTASAFSNTSLFQQIPDPVQQKSQAVPVINSPITPSYSLIDYEGNPRTSDTSSNYSNIIYNGDPGITNMPLTYSDISYDREIDSSNVPSNYPIINYIPRPVFGKEKIIIERTNCVPTITKASNVFSTSVSRSNLEEQPTFTNVNTNNQRFFSCKKTGKVLETDSETPHTSMRTLQSDLHWRKRTIELSQQEQEMNQQIELDWRRY